MTTATITISSKGQVTIPAHFIRVLHLSKGDRLIANIKENEIVIKKPLDLLNRVAGSLYDPKRKPVKDLDRLIEKAKEQYFREKWAKKLKDE